MTKISKSLLLLGVAAISLSACSGDKGPGDIGSKDDIVVINKGLPGAKTAMSPEGDFSASVEQAQAVPAPAVEGTQELTPPEEAVTQSAVPEQAQDSTTMTQETVPAMEGAVMDDAPPAPELEQEQAAPVVAQDVPVAAAPAPTEVPQQAVAASASVEATSSSQQAQPAPPVAPVKTPYPLDPNAPYSPKAMAAAAAAAGTPVTDPVVSPSGLNLADPALIRSVQAALAAKSMYVGAQTGMMDADLLNAITKFQADNKLQISGGLNEDTLKALGILKQ